MSRTFKKILPKFIKREQIIDTELTKSDNRELNEEEYKENKIVLQSFPRIMQLDITSCCNMYPPCVMCWRARNSMPMDGTHINTHIINKIKPWLKYLDVLALHSGGEPFTYPHLFELIGECKEGTAVIFKSNGVLLNPTNIENVVKYKVASISISLDAATPETYRKIRSNDFFDKILLNIKNLNEYKRSKQVNYPEIMINMTLMRQNIEELPQFIELAGNIGVKEVQLKRLNEDRKYVLKRDDFEFNYEQQHLHRFKELNDLIMEEAYEKAQELGIGIHFWGKPFFDEKIKHDLINPLYCEMIGQDCMDPWRRVLHTPIGDTIEIQQCKDPWQKLHISNSGMVRNCCSQSAFLGDLKKQSLHQIWNGKKIQKIRRKILNNEVPNECISVEYRCAYLGRK